MKTTTLLWVNTKWRNWNKYIDDEEMIKEIQKANTEEEMKMKNHRSKRSGMANFYKAWDLNHPSPFPSSLGEGRETAETSQYMVLKPLRKTDIWF